MHTIKLRGPWLIEALETSGGELPDAVDISVPGDWSGVMGSGFRGRARYTRRFGLPTNLGPEERVALVIGTVEYSATIHLNGQPLGQQIWDDGDQRYDVTEFLQPRNVLQIVVELRPETARPGREDQPGGLLGDVRLEITP